MKRILWVLMVVSAAMSSCSEKVAEPSVGDVLLIDRQSNFRNENYYIVSEYYFLNAEDPFWYRSNDDALMAGVIGAPETRLRDLRAGNYFVVFPTSRKSKVFQVIAGRTVECVL